MSPQSPGPSKTDLRRGRFPTGSIGDITAAEEAMLLGEVPPEPEPPRPDHENEKGRLADGLISERIQSDCQK